VARERSGWSFGPVERRAVVLLLLVVVGVSALAVDSSVTVEVRWRVLPYQSLRLEGTDREFSSSSFPLPEPTADDRLQGYSDVENALRIKITSNTPWRLQVRLEGSDLGSSLEVRRHGDAYAQLTETPVVLARGSNGTFDLGVDVRLLLSDSPADPRGALAPMVFTIMPD
jgi:hypothetical protein